jgi:hypothetical protein
VSKSAANVRIAVIPRFHEHNDDFLWPIDWRLTHGLFSSIGEGPLLGLTWIRRLG